VLASGGSLGEVPYCPHELLGGLKLRPLAGDDAVLAQLKRDLAVVISAEALFTLTDLCGLSAEDAIASAVHTARTLTQAAIGKNRLAATRV